MASIGGEEINTSVLNKSLSPHWNESFDMFVALFPNFIKSRSNWPCRKASEDTVLAIQIFDYKKTKKKDQAFLGAVNVRVRDIVDLAVEGDGILTYVFDVVRDRVNRINITEMLTRDIIKPQDSLAVHGKTHHEFFNYS